jgi:large subunit ribosomal protein L24
MPHIRKKDHVRVLAGKEKGREGEVIKVLPKKDLVFVSRVNMIKRHTKASQKNPQGGIVEKEGGIHISNVQLIRRDGADAK